MSDLVLVDSSAWIEVVRGRGRDAEALRVEVNDLLARGFAALAPPVWIELYQGVRSPREETHLETLRSVCAWLEFDEDCWLRAAEEGRHCLRQGLTIPQSDLLVHACARRHQARLLHRDRHFDLIDSAIPLESKG